MSVIQMLVILMPFVQIPLYVKNRVMLIIIFATLAKTAESRFSHQLIQIVGYVLMLGLEQQNLLLFALPVLHQLSFALLLPLGQTLAFHFLPENKFG